MSGGGDCPDTGQTIPGSERYWGVRTDDNVNPVNDLVLSRGRCIEARVKLRVKPASITRR